MASLKRGVIAAPGIIERMPRGFKMVRSISAEELRFYILYWDSVVIPTNNLVHIGVPGEKDLVACGAISRPRVQYVGRYEGDQVASAVLGCQALVAAELAKRDDVDWVLHQFGGDVLTPPGASEEITSLRISVASVLPVPPAEYPVAEVLEFKERRGKELVALHETLDALYFEILGSPDRDLGAKKLLTEVRNEIAGLSAGSAQSWRKFDLSIEFSFRPKDAILAGIAGVGLGAAQGWSAPLMGALSAFASLVEVKLSKSATFGTTKTRLAYLSSAKSERILP